MQAGRNLHVGTSRRLSAADPASEGGLEKERLKATTKKIIIENRSSHYEIVLFPLFATPSPSARVFSCPPICLDKARAAELRAAAESSPGPAV